MSDAVHAPYPPRFWWLKRILLSLLLIVVVLVVLRLVWGWRVQRELDALIASYRAKGEPTTAADFAPAPVPDAENAVPLLRQAAAAVTLSKALTDADRDGAFGRRPIATKNLRLLHADVAAHATALSLARQARGRTMVWWNLPLPTPYSGRSGPDWHRQWELGRLLTFASIGAHATGDDHEALEFISDALFVSRAGGRHPYSSMEFIAHHACVTLILVTPELAIEDTGMATSSRRAASRRQVRELIDELLDEAEADAATANRFFAERIRFTDFRELCLPVETTSALQRLVGHDPRPIDSPLAAVLLRPVLERNAIEALRHLDTVRQAVRIADWNVARRSLNRESYTYAPPDAPFPRPVPIVRIATVDFMRGGDMWVPSSRLISHRTVIAFRRAAALRLAVRLYELDHEGSLPPSLGALAPRYIPHVPADPFGNGKGSFDYAVRGAAPYMYSPGPDGKYDIAAGTCSPTDPRSIGWHPDPDFVFPLKPRPMVALTRAAAEATSSPVQDDQERVADEAVYKDEDQRREQQP